MRALRAERERRKWIGGTKGKRKGFAGPMSNCFLRPCTYADFGFVVYLLYNFLYNRYTTSQCK